MKKSLISVQGKDISVIVVRKEDYICLTDMVRGIENGVSLIEKWLRNKNTIEFLGIWEEMNNPNFNSPEFEGIKNNAGLNRFIISTKQWIDRTNAIGIIAKAGRYGGTYAHKDIAFEFGTWISPVFKLYLIKEYQRLKEAESNPLLQQWDVKRLLSKANYTLHTDAIKSMIPKLGISKVKERLVYASEADMLNMIMFGCTAKDWEDANPDLAKQNMNIRDTASINQLVVLSNIESLNAELIKQGQPMNKRRQFLHKVAKEQMAVFDKKHLEQRFRKIDLDNSNKLKE